LGLCGVVGTAQASDPAAGVDGAFAPVHIVSVESWGGSPSHSPIQPQSIQRITLHHQGESWINGGDVAGYLQRLQQWSRLTKRWSDIPYHFVVSPEGQIYAARDLAVPGDTNTEYNPNGHALIMLLGNLEEVQPSRAQLLATVDLMAVLVRNHHLDLQDIATHRDFSAQTLCPGKHLSAYVTSGWLLRAVQSRLTNQPVAEP